MRPLADAGNKRALLELFYRILRWSGVCYLLRKCFWRNQAAILYYHDPKPDVLDTHLSYLVQVSTIVSLPKLWTSFYSAPLAVITIDDGMIGNVQLRDVFQKHGVRPTLYLCTGIVSSGTGYWWMRHGATSSENERLKVLDNKTRKKVLHDLGFDQDSKVAQRQAIPKEDLTAVLDWADLGAHTRFHPILTRCNDQECQEEIGESRTELRPFIGGVLNDFAYPNGNYSDREVRFVKEAGFDSARTCDPGWNNPGSDRFRLKAISIDDEASVDKFAVQLTGMPAFARRLVKKAQSVRE